MYLHRPNAFLVFLKVIIIFSADVLSSFDTIFGGAYNFQLIEMLINFPYNFVSKYLPTASLQPFQADLMMLENPSRSFLQLTEIHNFKKFYKIYFIKMTILPALSILI